MQSRRFLVEGDLIKVNHGRAQKRRFFVFNDLIVYCKEGYHGRLTLCGQLDMDAIKLEEEVSTKSNDFILYFYSFFILF